MTALDVAPAEIERASDPPPPRPEKTDAPPTRAPRRLSVAAQVCIALLLLGVLVLGFAAYLFGLSGLSEEHSQTNLRKEFSHVLAQAVAPVGPVAEGTPVAALTIPRLGISQMIVLQGTSSRDLTEGPGHSVDSVLPGQTGVSVILGRRATFGAPFAHLMRLQVGDMIIATTGQGVAKYRVSSFGDSAHPAPANSANRIVLATADAGLVPHQTLTVSADLVTDPQPSPGVTVASSDQESLANGVDSSLLPTLLWSQMLLVLAVAVPFAATRWHPAATYLCAAPMVLAVLWNLYENIACMLPNLY